jgi:hypothetical protein
MSSMVLYLSPAIATTRINLQVVHCKRMHCYSCLAARTNFHAHSSGVILRAEVTDMWVREGQRAASQSINLKRVVKRNCGCGADRLAASVFSTSIRCQWVASCLHWRFTPVPGTGYQCSCNKVSPKTHGLVAVPMCKQPV